ncbi:MBL fold metallo-hydrolase [Pseudohalioglobus lutimaris]|uniref:MBL fold metallo-hydrolase n=1 Tax=Pseudohalioglobus lutimaris TaxID=1737061 RepID=A0A2N5X6J0_9GAMM|nr:MBL fold metallo-hydrolase [Pseudohalioglobus lutimaris]PLW70099.1 MBL fold metallo-hydrolase [Pseudohalioglobus lutimaris]
MEPAATEDLGFGITRIDADYLQPGLVCFYLLESNGEYALVETGTQHSVPRLQALMQARGIAPGQVRYVIPTHVHLDHAGGAGVMMDIFPNAELLAHPRGARHLIDPARLVQGSREVYGDEVFQQLYGDIRPVAARRVIEVADGETVQFGGRRLLLRHTPGHADHHFCIWDEVSRGWFSGDVFGISYDWFRTPGGDYSMPATTPTQFRPEALKASLVLLGAMGPVTIYLTHFGALAYTREKQQMLMRQIDDYVALARDCAGDAAVMEEALMDYSQQRVEEMNAGVEMRHMRERFRHDAHLNAQGLAVWMQRQQI